MSIQGSRLAYDFWRNQSKAPQKQERILKDNNNYSLDINLNTIKLNCLEKINSVIIYNMFGHMVASDIPNESMCDFILPKGIYMLVIKSISGEVYTEKVVINY